jgi:glycosyltransferase involved in cell wall biosynthesis
LIIVDTSLSILNSQFSIQEMTKKKILLLTDWYEPGFKAGGPIQSCRNFVAAMHEEFEISVLTSDRDLGESKPYEGIQTNQWVQRPPGVSVYYADTRKLNTSTLSALIRERQPDFIYLNSMYSYRFSVIPLLFNWRNKISAQVVMAPRGMLQEGALQFKPIKKKMFINLLNLMGVPQKLRFHATDDQEKKDILKHFPKAKSVEEIPNFSAPLPMHLKIIEKNPGSLRAVYISRIIPKKNIIFFLQVLGKVPTDIELHFDIYGEVEDEPYWEDAKQVISGLPSNISVEYHGPLPHEKVNETLESSHIFVLPSKGENFGHAIFESWSAARPCLISDKTPWHHLKKQLTGWDLPLENEQAWLNALDEAGDWDQVAFESWCRNSREFAARHVGQYNLTRQYQNLFSSDRM